MTCAAASPHCRSSEWGTSPWHWYLTSALPRALHAGLLFAVIGVVIDRRLRPAFCVAATFLGLYSFLPHKEVRGGSGLARLGGG